MEIEYNQEIWDIEKNLKKKKFILFIFIYKPKIDIFC